MNIKEGEEKIDKREMKGIQIAHSKKLNKTPKGWIVPSQSGNGAYLVYEEDGETKCNCPDCEMRRTKCKHQWAVEYFVKETIDTDGNKTITKVVKMTYSQDWKAYNKSQTSEIELFDPLLRDLVKNVEVPEQKMGRPQLNLRDEVFCAVQKVYSQLSQRRAHTLFRNAEGKEQITHAPHFNGIGKLLNREDVTSILNDLLVISAMPLQSVETNFAPDSTGFRTSQFNQYAVEKYDAKKEHEWVKAHILTGTQTNVISPLHKPPAKHKLIVPQSTGTTFYIVATQNDKV